MVVRKRNSLVRHPAPLRSSASPIIPFRVATLIFLAENCYYAYTYDEVYSPVSIRRIDEMDKVKEERWKVIFRLRFTFSPFSRPHSYPPSYLCTASLYTTLSFFDRHSHSNAYTLGIRVLEIENAELYYMDGERVSSTQSRVFALTRRRDL